MSGPARRGGIGMFLLSDVDARVIFWVYDITREPASEVLYEVVLYQLYEYNDLLAIQAVQTVERAGFRVSVNRRAAYRHEPASER